VLEILTAYVGKNKEKSFDLFKTVANFYCEQKHEFSYFDFVCLFEFLVMMTFPNFVSLGQFYVPH
jgi:hypothetical protein